MTGMRICIICPVRHGTPEAVFDHVANLEKAGHLVFFPARDIAGTMPEIDICRDMLVQINIADEVHVWYSKDSQGVHFDLCALFTHWLDFGVKKAKWLNPSKNPTGYEVVLKEMCKEKVKHGIS